MKQIKTNAVVKVLTLKVIPENKEDLLLRIIRFNKACNYVSEIALREKKFYWLAIQRMVYHDIRDKFGLQAAETTMVIRKVAYAYKNKKRNAPMFFKPMGSITLHKHLYRNGHVFLNGLKVKVVAPKGVELPKFPKQATLFYRNGKFIIYQVVYEDIKEEKVVDKYLGCDLGVKNILTDSNGKIYSGGFLNNLRKRRCRLKAKLQSKGTRSAKKLLYKWRRKETLLARDVNHKISKEIVVKAKMATTGIALERLNGIRGGIRVRKAHRRQQDSWSFLQLKKFIEYKSQLEGIPLKLVNPRNTSRTCPECGHIDKNNRKTQAEFKCIKCGFCGHADTVAAINISRRAAGNQPYAPSEEDVQATSDSGNCLVCFPSVGG